MAEQVIDYYAILEVEKTATDKEIKASYRKLAAKYHPDVCQEENAQEIFQRIVKAYEVLGDQDNRREYDEFTKMMSEGRGLTFKDIYEKFNTSTPGAHAPIKGDDVEMSVDFLVSEVRQGLEKQIIFERYVNCDECEGHGFYRNPVNICHECKGKGFSLSTSRTPFGEIKTECKCGFCKGKGYKNVDKCSSCNGEGKKGINVAIKFQLPKETTDGFKLLLKGKGDTGLNGGRNGDLILNLRQSPDDPFKLVNDFDLTARLDVPFITALAGGNVEFTLPRGFVMKVPIARGAQTGDQIVVPDEGLFNSNNGFYGTVTLKVNILVPSSLSGDKMQKLISILS